ncbi:MAG: ATP-binding cassette domain-containing protein, partial [Cetobacterium sp.]
MEKLLNIKNLSINYEANDEKVMAVTDLEIELAEGETLGLVGETGAGKTTTALGIMRLVPNPPGKIISGEINFQGRNLLTISEEDMRAIRGRQISMIFQDPMTSLNP